jgi:3',5'-cyclic-nucleotide phosphodiesterase
MEEDLGIPSTLYAPPIRDDLVELGKSQIGFMNLFALPLFQGVTDVLPAMQFTVDELHSNKTIWEGKLQEENDGTRMSRGKLINNDGVLSPRSGSVESFRGSPEQHPPAIMATPPTQSHFSPITQAEISRPNSIGTFGQLTISQSPDQSRRSSLGSPLFIATPDIASQRSSGAFPGAFPSPTPRLQARRSSNTVPSQLQLGLNHPLSTSSPKLIEDGTQSEPDSSVVTMVVNGSKEVQPSAVRPSTASKATNGSFAERYEADSTGTELGNPANGTTYPYSPLSGATSIMSSTEKIDSILPRESYPVTFSSTPRSYNGPQQDFDSSNISRENIPSMKQRNSRFRLNFWKTKRRTQTTTTL